MRKLFFYPLLIIPAIIASTGYACNDNSHQVTDSAAIDTVCQIESADSCAIDSAVITDPSAQQLNEKDYQEVANRLGIEVAAIKAVVEIEAGKAHKGFWAPGKPLVNYDMSIVNKFAPKLGVSLSKYRKSHPEIWGASKKKYGSSQAAEWARFEALRAVNNELGIYGCFWGMFQIGGFNWKLCKTKDANEFFMLMSRSERDQLELFANFIESSDMVKYLKAKNWAAFASRYNGPSYRSRGYHTRMANAYAKYSKAK